MSAATKAGKAPKNKAPASRRPFKTIKLRCPVCDKLVASRAIPSRSSTFRMQAKCSCQRHTWAIDCRPFKRSPDDGFPESATHKATWTWAKER